MICTKSEYKEYLAADALRYQKQQGGWINRIKNYLETHPISNR